MTMKRWTVLFLAALGAVTAFGERTEIRPIPLGAAANAARIDMEAADGKGGWLDLGSNDLHVLPAGLRDFGGVPFDIPPDAGEDGKTCLVLGRPNGARTATVEVPEGISGKVLYLLHATADAEALLNVKVGAVVLTYADGSTKRQDISGRRDAADWMSGRSFQNCVRVWSEYNHNTQVSLFVSQFAVDRAQALRRISFEATGKCPWMVVGMSLGEKRPVKRIEAPLLLTKTYRLPTPPESPLARPVPGQRPKNVILIIGDGMGRGAIGFTSTYCRGREKTLLIEQFPVATTCTTVSVEGKTTDSAAAATALATGSKTMNGMLGLRARSDAERKSATRLVPFSERLHARGVSVGLLTNDPLFGATPSGFYAHVSGRGEAGKIAAQAAESGFEILIGNSATLQAFSRDDMAAHGYVAATTPAELRAADPAAKVFGAIDFGDDEEGLSRGVAEVIRRLARNERGFFLMAESATPDHGSHSNIPMGTVMGVAQVDWMAKAALDFATARGDTLVLVTGDHETGGVNFAKGVSGKVEITYTTTGHTERPVAFYAYGPGAERFEGGIDNTDVAKIVSSLLMPEP